MFVATASFRLPNHAHAACTSSPSGGRNEEGTSCEQDDDCCSGMICMPRVAYNPSTVADVALVTNPTSPTQADLRLFNVAPPGKADGLSVLPRECTALARELVWTNWAVSQYNSSAINASASVFCPYLPADLSWGINGTANASAPTNFTEADPVPWETWASQLCEDLSAAGQKLAEAFKKGGLAAARAFNASLYTCPPNGPNLLTLFYNSINPPFTGGWDSVVEYAWPPLHCMPEHQPVPALQGPASSCVPPVVKCFTDPHPATPCGALQLCQGVCCSRRLNRVCSVCGSGDSGSERHDPSAAAGAYPVQCQQRAAG
jgi:hypothetical protein